MVASPDLPLPIPDLVRMRRSIRRFDPRPVPIDTVLSLLADAVWAPSPHNSQPWRFTVLPRREDRARLAEAMAARLADEMRRRGEGKDVVASVTRRSVSRIEGAPLAILVSLQPDGLVRVGDDVLDALEWQMAVQSVGSVVQSLFLLAAARGIGTCWMAAPLYCTDAVQAALALPADYTPQALVLMGYPADGGRVRPRRDLDAVVEVR